jgi:hypothetical protein
MNGLVRMEARKKWQNVSVSHQVRQILHPKVFSSYDIVTDDFKARDILWSPDGKGMVLLDKDCFCCAIEVEDPQDGNSSK